MASNPMQRKSRNSFLLGIIVTLLITGVIIAFLFLMLKNKNDELQKIEKSKVSVYTLNQNVKAGQVLTEDMFELKKVQRDLIPSSATATSEKIESWFLQTKSGEAIQTDEYGLYLKRNTDDNVADTIIEVRQNNSDEFKDSKGNKVSNGDYYVHYYKEENGNMAVLTEKIESLDSVMQDEYGTGMYIVNTQGKDIITRVYQENTTGEYYVLKIDSSTLSTSKQRIKEYLDIQNVPVLAKVNMDANTVLTPQLVVQSDERITDDVREEEYNMVILPIDLASGDYVDIRLQTPAGQNFIVVSKAKVEVPQNNDGSYIADTIKVNLREDEILSMSSAIVEAYGIKGARLYAVKYVEPAMQEEAYPTYTPNAAVTAQIDANGDGEIDNPNLVQNAKQLLATRYSETAKAARNNYLNSIINNQDGYINNISEGMEEDIGAAIVTRQEYLESLQND